MSTSVLLYDPAKKRHVLLLKEDPWAGKPWIVDLRICDNPLCGCFNINFLCVPSETSPDHKVSSIQFALDVKKRCVYRIAGCERDRTSDAVAEAVASELGDSGWDYLWQFLLGVKQEQIDECDVRRLDADFPPDILRGETSVAGYGEIFPFAPTFSFSIESQRWVAVDDYCVSPDCECRDVVLQFVRKEREHGLSGKVRDTVPAMYYNYKARTFQEANAPAAHQPSSRDLLAAMRAAWPGFETEAKKRHKRMKILFNRALQIGKPPTSSAQTIRAAVPPAPQPEASAKSPAKAGRNDPCPCGSCRKYKKCCGR